MGQVMDEVLQALSEQASRQFELLKAEQARDTTALARSLLPIVVRGLMCGLGYLFTVLAVALALGNWLGAAGGFAAVGGAHLIGGGLALRASLRGDRDDGTLSSPDPSVREDLETYGGSPLQLNSSETEGQDVR